MAAKKNKQNSYYKLVRPMQIDYDSQKALGSFSSWKCDFVMLGFQDPKVKWLWQ